MVARAEWGSAGGKPKLGLDQPRASRDVGWIWQQLVSS